MDDWPHPGQVGRDRLLIYEMSFSPDPHAPIDLDPETVEAITRRVAELLARTVPGSRYLDTAGVAEMLGVSEE